MHLELCTTYQFGYGVIERVETYAIGVARC